MKLSLYTIYLLASLLFTPSLLFGQERFRDSLALVSILRANPQSTLSWDSTTTIDTWERVKVENGRVVQLRIFAKEIEVIPPDISELTELQLLFISDNPIKSIPSELVKLTKLNNIALKRLSLEAIPPILYQMPNLEIIDLQHNKIEKIESSIANLLRLRSLALSNNSLTSLPPELIQLRELNGLGLGSNRLTALPEGFSKLSHMEFLTLEHNSFVRFPDELKDFKNLIHFKMSNNFLTFDELEKAHLFIKTNCLRRGSIAQVGWQKTAPVKAHLSSDSTTLTASLPGVANIYQWYRNSVIIEGETDSTLTITSENILNNRYHCFVRSGVVSISQWIPYIKE